MKRKITVIIMGCLILTLALAGCVRNNNTPSPSPTVSPVIPTNPTTSPLPDMTPDMSPGTSINPGNTGDTGEVTMNNAQAAEAIKAELDKMSEVENAHVVVLGNVALVGVEFTSQYQGGVTDRINEMVVEKAKATDEAIIDIIVTDMPDHVSRIKTLAEKTGEAIHNDVAEIIEKIRNAA